MNIIEVNNLRKSYGAVEALKGVSFAVEKGEIFGLLGPNGAGKTTTLEILEGLRKPDSGSARILGRGLHEAGALLKNQIGIVLQTTNVFPNLNLKELLALFASFYQATTPFEHLIEKFGLKAVLKRHYQDLSSGQRQRLALALALLHEPELLFLDEPTVGLDPAVRQKFWEMIFALRQDGLTIVLTTHYMEEAEILCDRVGIIDHGRLLVADRPVKLINSLGVASHIRFMSSKPIPLGELEQLAGAVAARRERYFYDLESESPEVSLRQLLEWEKNFSGKIFNLQVQQATLEDVFLKLTGHSLRE